MSTPTGREHPLSHSGTYARLEVGARVEIIGEPGIYLISHIDRRRHVTNLLPLNGGKLEIGIHISAIRIPTARPVPAYVSKGNRLIAEILGDGPDLP